MPFPILFFITQYSVAPEKTHRIYLMEKSFHLFKMDFAVKLKSHVVSSMVERKLFSTFFPPYSFETSLCMCVSRYAKALIQSFLKRKNLARKTVT